MSKSDAHLYGIPRPKKDTSKALPTSSSLAFTSQLSSLIAASSSSSSSAPTHGRLRPSATKPSIFTTHNKNAKKRALADLASPHPTTTTTAPLDAPDEHRSKRKMREKAKLYAAMKKGDYVPTEEEERKLDSLVDFDRKWAESGGGDAFAGSEEDSGSDIDPAGREIVEYEDEFGRVRTGTVAERDRQQRRLRNQLLGAEELSRMSARPAAPEKIIYGPTIQSAAFVADDEMEALAARADKEDTPPPETHYDASLEMRRRGTGFFAFDKDEEGRRAQMEGLVAERAETERVRAEKDGEGREARRRKAEEVERRREKIRQARARKQADEFLRGLGAESGVLGDGESTEAGGGGEEKVAP